MLQHFAALMKRPLRRGPRHLRKAAEQVDKACGVEQAVEGRCSSAWQDSKGIGAWSCKERQTERKQAKGRPDPEGGLLRSASPGCKQLGL